MCLIHNVYLTPFETGGCCDNVHTIIWSWTLSSTYNEETFLQDFLEILKQTQRDVSLLVSLIVELTVSQQPPVFKGG